MNPYAYNFYYLQAMLAVTLLGAFLYLGGYSRRTSQESFNAVGMVLVTTVMVLFIGTRPLSGVFVDMVTYAQKYEYAAGGGEVYPSDPAFDWLMRAMAPNFTVSIFFLVCAFLYILPLTLATYLTHGRWAFPALLSLLGSFSFFSYGVNGVRSGIAASIAILAFACHRQWALTYLLSLLAALFHKSVLVTVAFFIITRWIRWPSLYATAWVTCLVISLAFGPETSSWMIRFVPYEEERLESYLFGQGGDREGFRLDFILYSIVPVIISHAFATKEGKSGETYRRLLCTYLATNAFWLLCMYAAFSNRFAYVSWCILPWVILCPHLPTEGRWSGATRQDPPPSMSLLAGALVAHFAFTYFMFTIYYG